MSNDDYREDELEQETVNEEDTQEESKDEVQETEQEDKDAEIAKWKAIASRYKSKIEEAPKKDSKLTEQPDEDIRSDVQKLKLAEEKRQFGHEHGLSPAETDAVFRINPNPTAETLKDPFIQGGIRAIRSKSSLEENTPKTARTPFNVPKDPRKPMTKDELQENFEKRIQDIQKKYRK